MFTASENRIIVDYIIGLFSNFLVWLLVGFRDGTEGNILYKITKYFPCYSSLKNKDFRLAGVYTQNR